MAIHEPSNSKPRRRYALASTAADQSLGQGDVVGVEGPGRALGQRAHGRAARSSRDDRHAERQRVAGPLARPRAANPGSRRRRPCRTSRCCRAGSRWRRSARSLSQGEGRHPRRVGRADVRPLLESAGGGSGGGVSSTADRGRRGRRWAASWSWWSSGPGRGRGGPRHCRRGGRSGGRRGAGLEPSLAARLRGATEARTGRVAIGRHHGVARGGRVDDDAEGARRPFPAVDP